MKNMTKHEKKTPHCNTEPNIVGKTIYIYIYIYIYIKSWEGARPTTLWRVQGNRGKIRKGTTIWSCTEISNNKSIKYAKHILETRSANCINVPNNKLDVIVWGSRKRTCIDLANP